MQGDALLAAPVAVLTDLPAPQIAAPTRRRAENLASRRLDAESAALRDAFAYRLLTRNCATELLTKFFVG